MLTKYGTTIADARAVTSGASVVNANGMKSGDAQAAFIQNDVAYYAYNGLYMFDGQPILEELLLYIPKQCNSWLELIVTLRA